MSRLLTRDRASSVLRVLAAISGEPSVAAELTFGPSKRLCFVRIRPGRDRSRSIRISHFFEDAVVPRIENYESQDDFAKAYNLV